MQTKNQDSKFPPANELYDLVKKHGIEDPYIEGQLLSYAIDPNKDNLKDFWEAVMPRIMFNQMFTSVFSKPTSEVDGEIKIGLTELGQPAGFDIGERHLIIVGRTGSGKSTLLMLIFAQLLLK